MPRFILSFSLAVVALCGMERAALADLQAMRYDVYAGGLHALEASLTMDTDSAGRYGIVLSAKTHGLLGKLAPWHGTFESYGWRGLDTAARPFFPQLHRSTATWRKEKEVKSYRYRKDGSFVGLESVETGKKPRHITPDPALTDQTTDALAATLEALHAVSTGRSCTHSADVFDGKRRFSQVFTHKRTQDLKASRYNIFEGPAEVCAVEIIPKGGAWHKKPRGWMSIQEQGREKGTMPLVWMGHIHADQPAVPVKILVKTNYGTLLMHLTGYDRIQGKGLSMPENR